MKSFKQNLIDSSLELKRLRVLTTLAVMGALGVALEYAASINITQEIKIGFSGIPNQIVDLLFGPVTGAVFAGAMDVLKFFIKPTGAFHFGFTFDAMLAAFIYGCFYYRRPVSIVRIFIAKLTVTVIVNMGFATLWLSQLYGKGFFALLPGRALKDIIAWPIESAIFNAIATALAEAGVFKLFKKD